MKAGKEVFDENSSRRVLRTEEERKGNEQCKCPAANKDTKGVARQFKRKVRASWGLKISFSGVDIFFPPGLAGEFGVGK